MNDLIHAIRSLNCGVPFDEDDSVSILLYADDIVLLSDNEQKLQTMLDCLNDWCHAWGLTINFNKSKAMHFRTPRASKTECLFLRGNSHLELVTQDTFLGVLFTEHLNFMLISKIAAQSASRAMGLLISKDKLPVVCPSNVSPSAMRL